MAEEHRLDVAHPAACSRLDCPGANPALVGIPAQVLRFTSWVPKTAPLFSMPFLQQHVTPTLDTAASGELAIFSWMPGIKQRAAGCNNSCDADLMPYQGQAGPCIGAALHTAAPQACRCCPRCSSCSIAWCTRCTLQPQVWPASAASDKASLR